jgi:Flp pilus assembly CpaE family ATPase
VLAVGAADPVAVQRLVRALDELRDVAPGVPVRVVLNKVRRGPIGQDPERQLAIALDRYAGVSGVTFLPYDTAACDAALAGGRLLSEAAPGSALRTAIAGLSAELAGRAHDERGRSRRRLLRWAR